MPIRRRSLLSILARGGALALVLSAGCSGSCGGGDGSGTAAEIPATTVYVVRHAEKEKGPGDDPDLSARGKLRALALPEALELESISAIYSTDTKRTQQTVAPVAALTGVEVTRMPPTDYEGLLERVHSHAGKAVVVVGHSNTVPPMLSALGVRDQLSLDEDDYGDLFVVTVPVQGAATLEVRRFGDDPPKKPPL